MWTDIRTLWRWLDPGAQGGLPDKEIADPYTAKL